MDKLYIGDIPSSYCYARFSDNHIDLFNTPNLQGFQEFYRIYNFDNAFYYEFLNTTFTEYTQTTATQVEVTNDWYYRRDMPSIMFMSVVEVCIIVLLFNIVTSIFKKGGLLSGLL